MHDCCKNWAVVKFRDIYETGKIIVSKHVFKVALHPRKSSLWPHHPILSPPATKKPEVKFEKKKKKKIKFIIVLQQLTQLHVQIFCFKKIKYMLQLHYEFSTRSCQHLLLSSRNQYLYSRSTFIIIIIVL